MEYFDIIIIGAGWHGLAMGKTYREVNPEAKMLILDSAASVGGTWCKERLYPGLKTNNLVGSYEFSDFPMTYERFGMKSESHIPGTVVHEYLRQFTDHFNLTPCVRLGQRVESAEQLDDGKWRIKTVAVNAGPWDSTTTTFNTDKLVVATGLTSEPSIPKFAGQETFNRNLFHAKELRHNSDIVAAAAEVVVLGGNKSAWDTCYFAAMTGSHVHMVMRPSGGGPSFVWPVYLSPLRFSIQQIASTRLFTLFDPCIFAESTGITGWIRWFLHQTYIGRVLVSLFWSMLVLFAQNVHHYNDHPETTKLKPWINPFWMGNSLSIHNYGTPRWFDLVRQGKITIHIADITRLSEGTIHLSNSINIKADALICCTGWAIKPPIKFLPESLPAQLGLQDTADPALVVKARRELLAKISMLRAGPTRTLPIDAAAPSISHSATHKSGTRTRYLLYRFMIPSPSTHPHCNIAFIGSHLALTAIPIAQLQALWITAFFNDTLLHLRSDAINHKKVDYETVLHNEYTRIRHPAVAGGAGERCPDIAFDCLAYMDLLVRDLGMERLRKRGWRDWCLRYGPRDYVGIVEEWVRKSES